jgi:hypothetical protein
MYDPRPAMISARPPEMRSRVANCWKTRTGSSERQHDGRGRHREVAAVVLADREDVQAGLVRYLRLLDQFADSRPRGRGTAGHRVGRQLAEVIEAKFECQGGDEDVRLRAWTDFVLSYNRLMAVLEREMQDGTGITLSQYDVLLRLAEAPGGRLKMSELAQAIVYSTD